MRIGCLGMSAIDTLLFAQSLPLDHDDLSRINDWKVCIGGKGVVTALALLSLSCEVSIFTLVGKEEYDEVAKLLPVDIDKSYILPWLLRNNKTWIATSNNQNVYTFVATSSMIDISDEMMENSIRDFLSRIDILYISMEKLRVLQMVIEIAKRLPLTIISNCSTPLLIDPDDNSSILLKSLVTVSHTLVMNEIEDSFARSKLDILDWAMLPSTCLREVIVTKGEKGGVFSSYPFKKWKTYTPWHPKQVRCVIGAGDTFNGAYIKSRFIDDLCIETSCEFAAKIAAKKIEVISSSLFTG